MLGIPGFARLRQELGKCLGDIVRDSLSYISKQWGWVRLRKMPLPWGSPQWRQNLTKWCVLLLKSYISSTKRQDWGASAIPGYWWQTMLLKLVPDDNFLSYMKQDFTCLSLWVSSNQGTAPTPQPKMLNSCLWPFEPLVVYQNGDFNSLCGVRVPYFLY